MKEFEKWIQRNNNITNEEDCRKAWKACLKFAIRCWDKFPFMAGGRTLLEKELEKE